MQTDPSLSKFICKAELVSIVDGYRLVYERKCKFDLHLIDPEVPERVLAEVNRMEDMIVKILVRVCTTYCITHILGWRRKQLPMCQNWTHVSKRLLLPLRASLWNRRLRPDESQLIIEPRLSRVPYHVDKAFQSSNPNSKNYQIAVIDEQR